MNTLEHLQPKEHMHKLVNETVPAMRWDGASDFAVWQKTARDRLADLLGIGEIEPYRTDARVTVEFDRVNEEIGCREIRFRFFSEKNVSVPCHLLIPAGAKKPLPVVICLQGHSKGMHISLAQVKYPGDLESFSNGDRDFARRAVREGVCALALEQRCFGECGGKENGETDCSEAALRAMLLGRTLIGERVWDVMRAIDVLETDFASLVDVKKVLCLGNSGGGTATTYAAALEERIKIAVPSCAVCRFADSIAAVRHCNCNYVPRIAKDFDMGDICALTAPRALIIVNGKDDTSFPIDGARACFDVAKKGYAAAGCAGKIHHVIGNAGHRFYADDSWGLIREAIAAL